MKLILGPGTRHQKLPTEFLIDRIPFPGVDLVHDLDVYPWPLKDNSCISILASHVIEHLKMLLVPFMDECHRLLQPGGTLYLWTPLAGASPDLEFCDPTHIRCYRRHSFINYFTRRGIATFGYTNKEWEFPVLDVDAGHNLIVQARPVKNLEGGVNPNWKTPSA